MAAWCVQALAMLAIAASLLGETHANCVDRSTNVIDKERFLAQLYRASMIKPSKMPTTPVEPTVLTLLNVLPKYVQDQKGDNPRTGDDFFKLVEEGGCVSARTLAVLFGHSEEGRNHAARFVDGAFMRCLPPKTQHDVVPKEDCFAKPEFNGAVSKLCRFECKEPNPITGEKQTFSGACIRKGPFFEFSVPAHACGLSCSGPWPEDYLRNHVFPTIPQTIANDYAGYLPASEMDRFATLRLEQKDAKAEEILLLHGGAKRVHNYQFVDMVNQETGQVTTKHVLTANAETGLFNNMGCPATIRKRTPQDTDETRIVKITLKSGKTEEFVMPMCRISCWYHYLDSWVDELFGAEEDMAVGDPEATKLMTRAVRCEYNPEKKTFSYPPPILPRCLVGRCWGYPGADEKIGKLRVGSKTAQQRAEYEPDRWWGGDNKVPDFLWMVEQAVAQKGLSVPQKSTYNPPDVVSNEAKLVRVRWTEGCPSVKVSPTPVPNLRTRADDVQLPIPFPKPAQAGTLQSLNRPDRLFSETTSLRHNRQLVLAPWPGTKERFEQVGAVVAAPFPVVHVDCQELNKRNDLTKNGQIKFEDNPNFDPSKDPWELGGLCRPISHTNKTTPVLQVETQTKQEATSPQITEVPQTEQVVPMPPQRRRTECMAGNVGGVYFDGSPAFGIPGGALQMRVGVGARYLNTMSLAESLRHLQFSVTPSSAWGDALRGGFRCTEEMSAVAGLFTPGGDLGEFISAMASWEQEKRASAAQDVILSPEEVMQALIEWLLGQVEEFHLCIDHHMLDNLCRSIHWCPSDARAFVKPPPRVFGHLLELVQQPDFVGSRHVRGMLLHPEKYKVRAGLVQSCLRAVYAILWDAETPENIEPGTTAFARQRISLSVVPTNSHRASAVFEISGQNCPSGVYPQLSETSGGSQAMVLHMDAAENLRLKLAAFLVPRLQLDTVSSQTVALVHAQISFTATQFWESTMQLYSDGLPRFCVHYEPPNQEICGFRAPFPASLVRAESQPYKGLQEAIVSQDPTWWARFRQDLAFEAFTEKQVQQQLGNQAMRWVEPLFVGFGSVDGRQQEAVLGAPGGDIGQFILALAAYEHAKLGPDGALSEVEITNIFVQYLKQAVRPVVTMPSDTKALGFLCQTGFFCPDASSVDGDDDIQSRVASALRALMGLNSEQARVALEAVVKDVAVGDPFLKLLVQGGGEPFGVRQQLAAAVIRAFYMVLWNILPGGSSKHQSLFTSQLDIVILLGDAGAEKAVIFVANGPHAPSNQAPLVRPDFQDAQIVVYHEQASQQLRLHFLEFLSTKLPQNSHNKIFANLRLNLELMAAQVVDSFLQTAFPGVPCFRVLIE